MVGRNGPRAVALALLLACGGAEETTEAPAAAEASAAIEVTGRYRVTGVTIGGEDGPQRSIHGYVNLVADEAGGYKAHVDLETHFPGGETAAAQVVGSGEGSLEGRVLDGTASTQLVAATVPGVDVGFAYVPREVGQRIRSRAHAEFFPDGSVHIELENEPGPDETYRPTRTELVGHRVDD